jgi:hypothetical protein
MKKDIGWLLLILLILAFAGCRTTTGIKQGCGQESYKHKFKS